MDFYNEEIFIDGHTADGRGNSAEENQKMVEDTIVAINTSNHKIPLKLGHYDDEQWSKGWVANIRKIGSKIVADFLNIPDEIGKKIKDGYLPSKSIEIVQGFKTATGKILNKIIDAVALLGTEKPAIPWLRDNETGVAFGFEYTQYESYENVMNDWFGEYIDNTNKINNTDWYENLIDDNKPDDGIDYFPYVPSGTVKREWTIDDIDTAQNEYQARVRNPNDFDPNSFRRIAIEAEKGIYAIIGMLLGEDSTRVQSYRFDKSKWDRSGVVSWLNAHLGPKNDE